MPLLVGSRGGALEGGVPVVAADECCAVALGHTTVGVVRSSDLSNFLEVRCIDGALIANLQRDKDAIGGAHGHNAIILEAPVHGNEDVVTHAGWH